MTLQLQEKRNVLGVLVDVVDYDTATELLVSAARDNVSLAATALAVHGVMTGVQDPEHAARLNSFDLVTPDGQPVRWAMRLLHGTRLEDRVYGPLLTERVLERCAADNLPVYLYGSTEATLRELVSRLEARFDGLDIVGAEPSKFRLAEEGEADELADRIRKSKARLVLVGLGCPRQEVFAYGMRSRLEVPILAVGAAFDYHAGNLRIPPSWMQRAGLEWLWRFGLEPARLWRRYLLLNPAYLFRVGLQKARVWPAHPHAAATGSLSQLPI